METRRGFLKLFAGLVASNATEAVFGKTLATTPPPQKPQESTNVLKEIIWKAYFPLLKQNEEEHLCFYKCPSQKTTVGYGTNAESNTEQFKKIPIFYKSKELKKDEKEIFLKGIKQKDENELKKYSISRESAEKMAKDFTFQAIQNLIEIFHNQHFNYFNFPLPMQLLALDIYYNVGKAGFLKYKRFRKALIKKDYKKALKESKVKAGKSVNQERERRKGRLFAITQIRAKNPNASFQKTKELVEKSYKSDTPKLTQVLVGKADKVLEEAILLGDFKFENSKKTYLAMNQNQPPIHV